MTETSPPYDDPPARLARWIVLKKTAGIYPGEFSWSPLAIVWAALVREAQERAKVYFREIPDYQIEVRLAWPEETAPEIPHLTAADRPAAPSMRISETRLEEIEGSTIELAFEGEPRHDVADLVAEIRRYRALLLKVSDPRVLVPNKGILLCAFCGESQHTLGALARDFTDEIKHTTDCPWSALEAECRRIRAECQAAEPSR